MQDVLLKEQNGLQESRIFCSKGRMICSKGRILCKKTELTT